MKTFESSTAFIKATQKRDESDFQSLTKVLYYQTKIFSLIGTFDLSL